MAPQGPDQLICGCRPHKPCFESIEKLVAKSKGNSTRNQEKLPLSDKRYRDIRQPDPELDEIPTVQCRPPEQASVPARYPGAPCYKVHDENGDDEDLDSGGQVAKIKRNLQTEASKSSCPCEACGKEALFEECANPYIEFERKYLASKGGDNDVIPASQLPHDCQEHRNRPRDQAPGDPETDLYPRPCQESPCCLAFRPHPPATLATPDLYRTCSLPKRFRYPSWFKGYGISCQHPLYRTTNAEIGKYPPTIHTVPTVYHTLDRSYSKIASQIGPYRDKGLRTTGSIWDAYSYYDFW